MRVHDGICSHALPVHSLNIHHFMLFLLILHILNNTRSSKISHSRSRVAFHTKFDLGFGHICWPMNSQNRQSAHLVRHDVLLFSLSITVIDRVMLLQLLPTNLKRHLTLVIRRKLKLLCICISATLKA